MATLKESDLRRFTIFTLLGVIPWCVGLALAGKALGAQWDTLEKYFAPVGIIAAIALVALIAWWIWKRRQAPDEIRAAGEAGASDRLD